MELRLSPAAQAVIDEKLASGQFASADAVVDAALALLHDRDGEYGEYGEWLRAEVRKGDLDIEEGRVTTVDAVFWERVRGRYTRA